MNDIDVDILLVEDSQDDIDLTLHTLGHENLANHIFVVRDGEEALDFLFCSGPYADRNPAQLPKLVLLDLKLPKLDGMEVLERLRADPRTSTLPVVIMTSSKEERDVTNGYHLGCQQLHPEASGFRSVPPDREDDWAVLATDQSASPESLGQKAR
jgi:two-component system response regulator